MKARTDHSNVAGAIAALLLACLFLPADGRPQQAGGAIQILDIEPKASLLGSGVFATACTLDAAAVEAGAGCAGAAGCGAVGGGVAVGPDASLCDLPGGLDHVAAGTGLRNSGWGAISLRGAPPGAVTVGAWLYWGVITDDPGDPAAHRITFAGNKLDGELVATSPEPCWSAAVGLGETGGTIPLFAAYRVPVLRQLQAGINGDYSVSLPISPVTGGYDPWQISTAQLPLVEGAGLVVAYAHRDVPRGARFYLHHGARLLLDWLSLEHPLDPPLPASSQVRHTRLGADGQRQTGLAATAPLTTSFSVNLSDWRVIRGKGSIVDPSPDWQGADGGPINQLWDTQVTDFSVQPGELEGFGSYWLVYDAAVSELTAEQRARLSVDCVAVVAHALTARQ